LIAEVLPEQLNKTTVTDQDIEGGLNEMLGLIQNLCDKSENKREGCEMDVKSSSMQLNRERADCKEDERHFNKSYQQV
jgi:hypothetical protein